MRFLLAFALGVLPALNTLTPHIDNDTWFHLAIGRDVARNGAVPTVDPFSRMSRESPVEWKAYSWLFGWGVYHVHAACGLVGLFWLRNALVAISVASLSLFAWRRAPNTVFGILVAAAAPVALFSLGKERPWHLSIAFTVAVTWLVVSLREGASWKRGLAVPLLFALWANVHIQFVMGWGVLGLACLFPGKASRGTFLYLLAASILACMLNPYGPHLFGVILELVQQKAAVELIVEMGPPAWNNVAAVVVALMLLASAIALVRRRPVDGFEVLLLLAGVAFTVRSQRDVWFGAIAALAVLRPTNLPRWPALVVPPLLVAATLGIRALNVAGHVEQHNYDVMQAEAYPVAAAKFLRRTQPPGPILNDFDWGGYLMWTLPEYPVSIDGRANLYGDAKLYESFHTWNTPPRWNDDSNFRGANLVLARADTELAKFLRERKQDWLVGHADEIAFVFVRVRPPSK